MPSNCISSDEASSWTLSSDDVESNSVEGKFFDLFFKFIIFIAKNNNKDITLKGTKHLENSAENKILFFKPGGSKAN